MKAVVYSKTSCPFCTKAKTLLEEKGVTYQEILVGSDISKEQLFVELGREVRTVPQIVVNGHYVGGYTELKEMIDSSRWDALFG